jgi:uncharacterized small protein (TIGR04563 family)
MPRKQSLYFPQEMLEEIIKEADRLDRSVSWVVQFAWKAAAERIKQFPSATTSSSGDGPQR